MSNQRYMQHGVSASKENAHNIIKNIGKGVFSPEHAGYVITISKSFGYEAQITERIEKSGGNKEITCSNNSVFAYR